MGLINYTKPTDGSTIDAADVTNPLDTIYNEFNGSIDNANIKAAAAIDGTKIAANTVSTATTKMSVPNKAFAYLNAGGQAVANTSPLKVTLNAEVYDTGSNFDSATNYRFTAPVAGFYQVDAAATCSVASGNAVSAYIYKNGAVLLQATTPTSLTTTPTPHVSGLIQLALNDYIELYVSNTTGSGSFVTGGTYGSGAVFTYLSIYLVSAT